MLAAYSTQARLANLLSVGTGAGWPSSGSSHHDIALLNSHRKSITKQFAIFEKKREALPDLFPARLLLKSSSFVFLLYKAITLL